MVATDFQYLQSYKMPNVCFALASRLPAPAKQQPRAAPLPLADAPLLEWAQHYLPHYFRLPPSRMHRWLSDELDLARTERGVKLNVVGPRGSAKSTVATLAYALRCAVEGTERYIWIISDTKHQASVHLENLRNELAENQLLIDDHAGAFARPPHVRGNIIRLANGVVIEAYGTGQRIRGKRRSQFRPSLIVCDDLQNDDHISSSWQRQRSREWFQGTLLKAGTKTTNIFNLATALHRDALAMELCRTPGWNSQIFQAIEAWPHNMLLWQEWENLYTNMDDPRRGLAARAFYEAHQEQMHAGVQLLWPDEENLYVLMEMRADGGRVAFDREKQGSPFDPSRCEWPEEYFNKLVWFDEWPTKFRTRVIMLDPSKGTDAGQGDYSAYVILAWTADDVCYVEANLERRSTPQMVADGVELVKAFRPDAFGIETNQFQFLLREHFLAEFAKQQMLNVHISPIENDVNKTVRIRRLGSMLARGCIRFKANSKGTKLLVEQLKEFPLGDHDDGPDALEMAVRLAGRMMELEARQRR